jgi:hypothetical protein
MFIYQTIGNGQSYFRCISGASLARCLRHMTPAQRAVLAAEIIEGKVVLQGLTAKAVAALTGSSQPYVNIALRLTPEERVEVAAGNRPMVRSRPRPQASTVDWWRQLNDEWRQLNDDALLAAINELELSTTVEVEHAN